MSAAESLLTPQEYLAIERASAEKHEYYAGEMYAMAGASRDHNRITLDLAAALPADLGEGECEVYSSDMRAKVEASGPYYPDVLISDG